MNGVAATGPTRRAGRTSPSPVVIGGVAGSGTRVYQTICGLAGYDMGRWSSARSSGDNVPLVRWFYPRWVDPYARGELDAAGLERMRRELRFWLRLCYPLRRGRWGWKNPRAQYVLPLLADMFPDMLYIHVLRDGRDQAFNPHFSYRAHETSVLSDSERTLDDPVRKALHWSRLNLRTEQIAAERLPGRFLRSRLEDLCAAPRSEVERILAFLGVHDERVTEAGAREVQTPGSLGRWQRAPREEIARVEAAIGQALEHYGYTVAG
ncbi:MAG TPA: sulfotransferase [Gemmatimonadota bacterium]|jgi:hypothetical protein